MLRCIPIFPHLFVIELDKDPTPILEKLAALEGQADPKLAFLLSRHPELTRLDWLNRWGPGNAWPSVLAKFSTAQLAYIAKAITVLERDLNWLGGSVAATIWIFRAYQARDDGNADELASWILANRNNQWSPFGTLSSARTLNEYRSERERRKQRRLSHLEREAVLRQRKEDDAQRRQQQAILRCAEGKRRAGRLRGYLEQLEAMSFYQRLRFLAVDRSFPLEAIPACLIAPTLPQVPELPAEIRDALLSRLDRRRTRRWRQLRTALGG